MIIITKVKKLVQDIIDIYKDNFRLFTILSFIGALIGFVHQTIISFLNYSEIVNIIIILIVSIPVYYFLLRINIALIIAIHYRYHHKDISIGYSYALSTNCFWNYLLTSLKLGIILAIPMILIVLTLSANINILIKIGGLIIMGTIALYIIVYYGFAPLVSILKSSSENYFNTSKRIVSSDLYLMIVMVLIYIGFVSAIYYTKEIIFRSLLLYSRLIQNSIHFLFSIFTTPLLLGTYVLLFYRLIKSDESNNYEEYNTLPNNVYSK